MYSRCGEIRWNSSKMEPQNQMQQVFVAVQDTPMIESNCNLNDHLNRALDGQFFVHIGAKSQYV
jgi:hypothetical protein